IALDANAEEKITIHALWEAASPIMNRSKQRETFIPWGVKHIRAPEAWRESRGAGVRVAVIDTGADFHHPDLQPSLARGINLLNFRALPMDDNGHGTHIAGTLAA